MKQLRNATGYLGPLILAACLSVSSQAAPPAVDALDRAEKLYRAGDLLEAEPLYQAVAGSGQEELCRQAYDRLLSLYARLGRSDRAVQTGLTYQVWLEERGDRSRLQQLGLELGQNYLALGHYPEAEAALQQALGDQRAASSLPPLWQLATWADLARVAERRRDRSEAARRWSEVERRARAALNDPNLMLSPAEKAGCVRQQADAYRALDRPNQAIAGLQPLQAHYETVHDRAGLREVLRRLATLHGAVDDHAAAEADLRRALSLPATMEEGPFITADLCSDLADVLTRRAQYAAASTMLAKAATAYRTVLDDARAYSPRSARTAEAFWKLEQLYERDRLYRQALRLADEQSAHWSSATPVYGRLRGEQGSLRVLFSAYQKARKPLGDALADLERQDPPDLLQLPPTLNALAVAELYTGRPARAAKLAANCQALYRRYGLPDDPELAETYNALGTAAALSGDYAEAMARYREGIACCAKVGFAADRQHSFVLLNLAVVHQSQGEPAEALQACQEALAVYRHFADPDALGFACFDAALANLYATLGRYAEADARTQTVLQLCARYEISGGPLVVTAQHCRALRLLGDRQPADAEKLWREVRALQEKETDPLLLPRTLNFLGLTAELQGRASEAEALFRRAADLQRQNSKALPATHFISLWRLAEAAYRDGRQDEALRLLGESVDVAEAARLGLYGDGRQRTTFFAQFVMAFERLVDWNVRAGQLEEACRAAARGRSRALLDQLQLAGVDPRQALRGESGDRLRRQEVELRRQIAAIQARARLVPAADAEGTQARELRTELDRAHETYAETWREILNANPLYHRLAADTGNDTLLILRQRVLHPNHLLLWYWIGRERSYLFLVGDATRPVEVFPLSVPEAAAGKLARASGPPETRAHEKNRGFEVRLTEPVRQPKTLTAGTLDQERARILVDAYLEDILGADAETNRGLRVKPRNPSQAVPQTAWEAVGASLLPAEACHRIRELKPEYLLVIPDGPLHKLPLESLQQPSRNGPRYALDELPPMVYAPSAAVLAMLAARPAPPSEPRSLLTVGNVAYGRGLPALPFSGEESRCIGRLFDSQQVAALQGTQATEKAVREAVAGRRFLHLATHGFFDERYGNLFGALALALPAPGREAPGDDGFLELREICQLPLAECELAVLSACETNIGPRQPLEAGVTLADGFLVAGARRVVASHWSVDDRSTAALMEAFFERLRTAPRDGPVSFARALQQARHQVRSRPEWAAPFHWAPFVLISAGD
jgi:CHAT domain-containing protein/tetratricopeptide (TPR) repeat protein